MPLFRSNQKLLHFGILAVIGSIIVILTFSDEHVHRIVRKEPVPLVTQTASYSFKHISRFENNSQVPVIPHFLINPFSLCSSETQIDHLILVYTAVKYFDRRQAIRETFGKRKVSFDFTQRVVFLMGTTSNASASEEIRKEAAHNGDVVQGDFEDTYYNLTLKGLMGLQWVSEHCSHADWVIKTDDDVFVNVFYIKDTVLPSFNTSHHVMGCMVPHTLTILRDPGSKWRVSDDQFRGLDTFPFNYCLGVMVILSRDLVLPMLRASRVVPYFWVEDVYLYGMLPDTIGDVTMLPLKFTMSYIDFDECLRRDGKSCHIPTFLQHSRLDTTKEYRNPWRRNYVKKFDTHVVSRIRSLWGILTDTETLLRQ